METLLEQFDFEKSKKKFLIIKCEQCEQWSSFVKFNHLSDHYQNPNGFIKKIKK